MSASQAEGRGFKSRFPLQESQGVTSYDVTPFLMRRCRCATNGPFPNLDQPPGEIPKPEHLHGVRPRPSLVQRTLQGETGNPFPVYGGGFHMRKCWPKRPTFTIGSVGKRTCASRFRTRYFLPHPGPYGALPALRVCIGNHGYCASNALRLCLPPF